MEEHSVRQVLGTMHFPRRPYRQFRMVFRMVGDTNIMYGAPPFLLESCHSSSSARGSLKNSLRKDPIFFPCFPQIRYDFFSLGLEPNSLMIGHIWRPKGSRRDDWFIVHRVFSPLSTVFMAYQSGALFDCWCVTANPLLRFPKGERSSLHFGVRN